MLSFRLLRFSKTISRFALVILAGLVLGAFLTSHPALAQGGATASLAGKVGDASGAVITAATVTVTQTDTSFSRSTKSTADGSFAFPVLPVGPYRLEVAMQGFGTYQQTGIVLTVNQAAQVSVMLKPGRVEQNVTVHENATPVETTTGTISQLIDQQQVVDLPLNGRNPAELVLLAPGVSNILLNSTVAFALPTQFSYPVGVGGASQSQGALAPVVNGLRPGGVYFSLDGANNLDAYSVTGGPFPNPDAVQEFRILTSGYGAEYLSAPGGVVNVVTRSGTNEFHGVAFEFLRNGAVNARNYFAAKSDNIHRNQFGGSMGGPIRKNKLFIFGSYQRTILRSSTGGDIQFVPTDAERAGNFSAIPAPLKNPFTGAPFPGNQIPITSFNPVSSNLLAMLPHSTAPDGRVEVVHPTTQDEDQGTVKVDYILGKNTFVGRYFISDFRQPGVFNPQNMLQTAGASTFRWQDAMIGHNYVGSKMVNEFRFTYQRNFSLALAGFPRSWKSLGANVTESQEASIEFMQVAGGFTLNGGSANPFPRETFTISDRVNLIRGRHQLSFGAEISRLRATEFTDHLQSGIAVWAPLPPFLPFTSGNVFADFVLGKATVFGQGDGLLARARGTLWGFYGEDQFRVTPRLSVTMGLRWDPYWPFHTLHDRAACYRPGQQSTVFTNAPTGLVFPGDPGCDATGGISADLKTLQPRVGFAYSLDEKSTTVIRGAYGMYSMQFPMQSFLPFASEQPYIRTILRMFPPSISNPWGGFPGGDPFANGFRADDEPRPSNAPFTPQIQVQGFTPNFKLGNLQKWNLTLERSFWGSTVARASYVGDKGTHLSLNREANPAIYIPGTCGGAPCSTTGNTQARRVNPAFGKVTLADSVGDSTYHALQLALERRVGSGLTISANYTWAKSMDDVSQNANGTLFSGFNTVTDPFNTKAYHALSDFDLSHSFSLAAVWSLPSFKEHGFVLKNILSRWQVGAIWQWQVGQPFSVYSGMDNSLTGNGLDFADLVPGVSPFLDPDRPRDQLVKQYFSIAAFQQNALGTFGNSGRNILRGPGYNNLDMNLQKTIPVVSERYGIVFRAEFFNLTNTPHFTAPGAGGPVGLSTPQATQILKARDPRILQFGLKFNW